VGIIQPAQAFTLTSKVGRLADLKTESHISAAFDPATTPDGHTAYRGPYMSVWDTGASSSVVSKRVVKALALKPVGMTVVHGVHGPQQVEQFLVNFRLPNGVQFYHILVTVGELAGCDALIGMDIITMGDFAVTNRNGNTVFSFRTPSSGMIDYVKLIEHGGVAAKGKKRR
jgi:hypothetical protein